MNDVIHLAGIIINLTKSLKWYGISVFDAIQWSGWIWVAWTLVSAFLNGLRGGSGDES